MRNAVLKFAVLGECAVRVPDVNHPVAVHLDVLMVAAAGRCGGWLDRATHVLSRLDGNWPGWLGVATGDGSRA